MRALAKALSCTAVALAACGLTACSVNGTAVARSAARACDLSAFSDVALQNATVSSASVVAANGFTPPGAKSAIAQLGGFCRIQGEARPSSDSLIHFELWVPSQGWNGKMVTTGNGGYSPALKYDDMAYAMRQGYAVLGGDTGHQGKNPNDMGFGAGHPEKIKDWGSRSIHAITVPAKTILAHAQGKAASRAYYYGCSTGGHQGYAQVQRYPQDFDGVIAGAPGNNRVALNAEFLWRYQASRVKGTSTPRLPPAKAALITKTAVAACDALDGVKDGVIDDPRACKPPAFDVGSLQCKGGDSANCLTAEQLEAARQIYQGPRNARTGEQIYPGPLVGTEAEWPGYWGKSAPSRAEFWSLWAFDDPHWDWWRFDWDRDYARAAATLGPLVDQTNADISAFKARGGKLLVFHGWGDPVVNPLDTIAYYERVRDAGGSQQAVDDYFRLFLVPGMGHCRGGTGPVVFGNSGKAVPNATAANDLLMALDAWVERGRAPEAIVAAQVEGQAVTGTRLLCPYPRKAVRSRQDRNPSALNDQCQP